MSILIGIGSKARQGKSFVANVMRDLAPERVQIFSLAEALKEECAAKHEQLAAEFRRIKGRDPQPPKDDPIYGWTEILQYYGTDVIRAADPDRWVRLASEKIRLAAPEIAIVPDVRFPNEADWIKLRGGTLVQVLRKLPSGDNYVDPGRDPRHPSEVALDEYIGWDFVLMARDGDLERLRQKAEVVFRKLVGEL